MLNKALRTSEVDILYKLRLFIRDLYEQVEYESVSDSITVYLGQSISRENFDNLQNNISNNDLLTFPQFLFGSIDRARAIRIAKELPSLHINYMPLILYINIPENMKIARIISDQNSIDDGNEVLLKMGIIGRIINIEKENIDENKIASIHLTLVQHQDQENIQRILRTKRDEIQSFSLLTTMVKLMLSRAQHLSAESLVETLFNDNNLRDDASIQGSIAGSLHVLATSQRNQEDFKRATDLYLLSLDTLLRITSPNDQELFPLHCTIATMFFRLNDYEKSHKHYQRALDIQLHSNNPDLHSIGACTNHIGVIYSKQRKYSKAMESFERTLKIFEQITEPTDAELALTYDNIGDAYLTQLKYDEALNNYIRSVEIQERIVPQNTKQIGSSHYIIGNIYVQLGRSQEALVHLKSAQEYWEEHLPLEHSSFAVLYNNIGLMLYREGQYSEALKSHFKSLHIASTFLPENHLLVGVVLFNIALVYSSQDKFDEAIDSIEKSTEQFFKNINT